MKSFMFVLLILPLCSCDAKSKPFKTKLNIPPPLETVEANDRFWVVLVNTFDDELAYKGERGIYMILDRKTKKEYFGVSGIGISELGSHTVGKSHSTDER